jgi:uncharacterized membrane protein required for colicin V production
MTPFWSSNLLTPLSSRVVKQILDPIKDKNKKGFSHAKDKRLNIIFPKDNSRNEDLVK